MSSDDKVEKIDLANDKFEDIEIRVNDTEKIKFDLKKWMPCLKNKDYSVIEEKGSEEEEEDDDEEEEKVNEEDQKRINDLKQEIETRKKKEEELKEKIREIEDKIELMKKILNIDVSEQQYVKDLSKKVVNEEIQA